MIFIYKVKVIVNLKTIELFDTFSCSDMDFWKGAGFQAIEISPKKS